MDCELDCGFVLSRLDARRVDRWMERVRRRASRESRTVKRHVMTLARGYGMRPAQARAWLRTATAPWHPPF
jgi:hypothetical protein